MTKQEEIREWVKDYLVGCAHGARVHYDDLNGYDRCWADHLTEELLDELSGRGVVIEVGDRTEPLIKEQVSAK